MGLRQSAQVELSSRQTSGGRPKLRLKIKPLRSRCPSPPPESAKIEAAATSPSSQGHSKTSSWGCYPPHRVHSPFKGELPQGLDPGWQLPAEHDWPACAQPDSSDSLHSTLECRLEAAQPASMQQGVESTHMGVPALPAVSIRPRVHGAGTVYHSAAPLQLHCPSGTMFARPAHPPAHATLTGPSRKRQLDTTGLEATQRPQQSSTNSTTQPGFPHMQQAHPSGLLPAYAPAWQQQLPHVPGPQQDLPGQPPQEPAVLPRKNSAKRQKQVSGSGANGASAGQPRQFVPYEIVWAKLASHPWWPAQVQLPTDQHLHLKHRPGDVFVVFYGDCNFAWVPRSGLAPFAADYSLRSKAGNKKLQGAVDAAWAALGRPRPLPESATGTIMLPEHLLSGQPALPHLPP